jgi:hypothetical protein
MEMQRSFDSMTDDFSTERPRLGLSGGINSAALLCYLATEHDEAKRPKTLLLYYAHLREHSPGTARFVFDCVRYARMKFPTVEFGMHRASVVDFFEEENFIPHPTVSPCTRHLKTLPMDKWTEAHGGTMDIIGFVRHERKRIIRTKRLAKHVVCFPIAAMSEEECFRIVDREIGWHPPIYDIKDENGKRLFTHNNCLPCKNMTLEQIRNVKRHFGRYYDRAIAMAERIDNYWGRPTEYPFDPCASCVFD